MYGHASVTQHSLWSGGGHDQFPAAVCQWIADVPEVAGFFFVFHFDVSKSGAVEGTVVN